MGWDKDMCSRGYGPSLAKVGKAPKVDVLLSWYDTMSIKYTPDQCRTPQAPSTPDFGVSFFFVFGLMLP